MDFVNSTNGNCNLGSSSSSCSYRDCRISSF
jgi:hypothetical protein